MLAGRVETRSDIQACQDCSRQEAASSGQSHQAELLRDNERDSLQSLAADVRTDQFVACAPSSQANTMTPGPPCTESSPYALLRDGQQSAGAMHAEPRAFGEEPSQTFNAYAQPSTCSGRQHADASSDILQNVDSSSTRRQDVSQQSFQPVSSMAQPQPLASISGGGVFQPPALEAVGDMRFQGGGAAYKTAEASQSTTHLLGDDRRQGIVSNTELPAKKKGRPKGSRNRKTLEKEGLLPPSPPPVVAAANGLSDIFLNPPLKKRGRPPGSKNRKTIDREQQRQRLEQFQGLPLSLSLHDPNRDGNQGARLDGLAEQYGTLTGLLMGHAGNSTAPLESAQPVNPPPQSAAAGVSMERFGVDVLKRYPELMGKFKVPGRKPGRPKGSKTINRRTKEEREAKARARALPSGKRRGRPPGSKSKTAQASLVGSGVMTVGSQTSNLQQASHPGFAGEVPRVAIGIPAPAVEGRVLESFVEAEATEMDAQNSPLNDPQPPQTLAVSTRDPRQQSAISGSELETQTAANHVPIQNSSPTDEVCGSDFHAEAQAFESVQNHEANAVQSNGAQHFHFGLQPLSVMEEHGHSH